MSILHTNSYTSWGQGTAIAKHGILVHSDIGKVAKLLNLVSCAYRIEVIKSTSIKSND